jgi:hypothetical protein
MLIKLIFEVVLIRYFYLAREVAEKANEGTTGGNRVTNF